MAEKKNGNKRIQESLCAASGCFEQRRVAGRSSVELRVF